ELHCSLQVHGTELEAELTLEFQRNQGGDEDAQTRRSVEPALHRCACLWLQILGVVEDQETLSVHESLGEPGIEGRPAWWDLDDAGHRVYEIILRLRRSEATEPMASTEARARSAH